MFGFIPQYLKDIKAKVETMKAGDTAMMRQQGDKPSDDLTLIISRGMLDPRKAQDIQDILAGKSTAHRRPGKTARKGNEIFGLVGR